MALDGSTVRVFVVDDHRGVRAGLAGYLATEPGMEVVGEAGNGREALDRISLLEEARVRAAIEAGAAGYVLEDADPDDLLHAVRAAPVGR